MSPVKPYTYKGGKLVKNKPKKRTRRAVKARRTLEQRESLAVQKIDEWLAETKRALSKVDYYQRELKAVRRLMAVRAADAVFE